MADRTATAGRVTAALSAVAAIASAVALFPSWYKGDDALADDIGTVLFNAPGILLLLESAVLLTVTKARTFGAGLLIGFAAFWSWEHLSDFGDVLSGGKEPGPGWIIGTVALGVMIAAAVCSVVVLRRDGAGFDSPGRRPFQLVAAGGISAIFMVAWFLPFRTTTLVTNAPGFTWPTTGTNVLSTSSSTLTEVFDWGNWDAANHLALFVAGPLILHCALAVRPAMLRSGLVTGFAVALAGTAASNLHYVLTPYDLIGSGGYTAEIVREWQLTGNVSAAGGLILYLVALVSAIGLAIWLWPRLVALQADETPCKNQPMTYEQPPQQPPVYVQIPQRGPTSGLGIASMVLGILWLYWIGSILAVIFGHVALSQIRKDPSIQGRGMAIAGVVLGWIGVGALLIVLIVVGSIGIWGD